MNDKKVNVLKDFFAMSHYETLIVVVFLVLSFVGLWYLTKRFKLKFQYRILLGLTIGLIFGLSISAIAGFPGKEIFNAKKLPTWGEFEWGYQANKWFSLFSRLFINGLKIMILPIIFLAIARIVSKQSTSNLASITWKGVAILLLNVAVSFAITYWLGVVLNVGSKFEIENTQTSSRAPMKSIVDILVKYMPDNFFKNMLTLSVVPVLILGLLVGYAIRKLTPKNSEQMSKSRQNLDRYWKICISVLMVVIKFMPYVVITMIGSAIFSRPIAEFASIGELIGLGYLGLFIAYGWHVLTVWLFGVSPQKFIVKGFKPVISGFLTQSSLATLPMSMDTLKNDMQLGKSAASPDVVMPLSTTIGLTGCAGVQAGVIVSFLYNAANSPITMNVGLLFLLGLIVTIFTSLGIAGVPGTATIVTIGVVSTLGFPLYVNGIVKIISPLNGIFDMGRTAVNVNGGLQASLIASAIDDELPASMKTKGPLVPILKKYQKWKARRLNKNIQKEK